jgi:large subunit ribosomal protein L22
MEVKAIAKGVGISAPKVRLYVDMVRGKMVEEALALLSFSPSPAAKAVAKVIKSAAANAENNYEFSPKELRITKIYADEGPRLRRYRPKARGRVNPILKRTSHITVIVEEEKGGT